jgi:cystathionine beta-lyase
MSFDTIIDRQGTDSVKWDKMQPLYGVSPDEGLSMWVADMDFKAPPVVLDALQKAVSHGIMGYTDSSQSYTDAICWWMKNRHDWHIEADWIFTTTGIVNAVGMCMDAYTNPGDGIIVFAPVYHAFGKVVRNAGRDLVELALTNNDGRYEFDFDAYDAQITGNEKMLILCSPHNPGGRVWTREELQGIADFCKRHDLLLVSDEIHHDLIMPGHKHIPMANVDETISDRLLMLTAPSKTFNLAGFHTGNVIIADPALRAKFADRMNALAIGPNTLGQISLTAAYSADGAVWVDELIAYIDGNRKVFDAAVNAIPGLKSMPLASTYLAWVDFSGTGMTREEFTKRVEQDAKIAANHGTTFGLNGDNFLRFNLGTQRSRVTEAGERLAQAFKDLQ